MNEKQKKVVLVGDTKKFMVRSVLRGLKEAGFEVIEAMPSINDLDKIKGDMHLYLLFMDEDVSGEVLIYLRDLVIEKDLMLIAAGNKDDLEDMLLKIPESLLKAVFVRPFNIGDVAEALNMAAEEEASIAEKKRILVVDDDAIMLKSIKSWLSEKYNVFIVNTGVDAITFLATNAVDLVLLDYMMPVADGPTVLGMIREQAHLQDLPVIFLTAKGDKESVMKVVGLKPEKYLLKNMKPEELLASIDDFFLEQKKKKIREGM